MSWGLHEKIRSTFLLTRSLYVIPCHFGVDFTIFSDTFSQYVMNERTVVGRYQGNLVVLFNLKDFHHYYLLQLIFVFLIWREQFQCADDEFGEKTVSVLLDGEESEIVFIDHPSSEMSVSFLLFTFLLSISLRVSLL